MERKHITDEELIEMIEGGKQDQLQALIANDQDLKKRYEELKEVLDAISNTSTTEVPLHIKNAMEVAISEEYRRSNRQFQFVQIAAAIALLVVGFTAGSLLGNDDSQTANELQALRTEIRQLQNTALTSTLTSYSASDRLQAVSRIEATPTISEELIQTLVKTFNTDESPNVRYAALQALSKYTSQPIVRYELVKSLESQADPLLQISLITILVEAEEKSARAPLKKLLEEDQILPEVKQQAEIALKVLI